MDLKTITSGIAGAIKTVPIGIYAVGALTLGAWIGFNHIRDESNPEYHFSGRIGDERVTFREGWFDKDNELTVKLRNGDVIKRYDTDGDFLSDIIYITTRQGKTRYSLDSGNPEANAIVLRDRDQGKMKEYLDAIMAIQTAPLNR